MTDVVQYKKKEYREYMFIAIMSVAFFIILISIITGKYLWSGNSYNSYTLQADSWLKGRLDLGQDYPWLELAIKDGKYFVSFPPFPSYVMLIFTPFCGTHTPDFAILYVFDILSVAYLFKIAMKVGLSPKKCLINSLFATIGSNFMFLMIDPSVWFIAQVMCFALASISIYYALCNKMGLSLLFWACSVGCRPMQALFIGVLICIFIQNNKDESWKYYLKIWKQYIPAAMIAISYMVLNYCRFGSITEFGHNYLPEFTRAENGQFSTVYIANNIKSLFAPIEFDSTGKMAVNHFGNLNMFIVSPIVIFTIVILVINIVIQIRKKELNKSDMPKYLCVLFCSVIYMFIIVMHKTMGAWQFGNRYSVDIIPWIFLIMVWVLKERPGINKYMIPLFIWGFGINIIGSVIVYNGL